MSEDFRQKESWRETNKSFERKSVKVLFQNKKSSIVKSKVKLLKYFTAKRCF